MKQKSSVINNEIKLLRQASSEKLRVVGLDLHNRTASCKTRSWSEHLEMTFELHAAFRLSYEDYCR